MRKYDNYSEVIFDAISENESYARMIVSSFVVHLDPTIDELNELKTAVSEAVTNSIIHGYDHKGGTIKLTIGYKGRDVFVTIIDFGKGIEDVTRACELFYTTKPSEERSGMGLTIIEAFSDEFQIKSKPNEGTIIKIKKTFVDNRVNYAS
jgi:stage II sporulation protein AB (anti-sigma F factor)